MSRGGIFHGYVLLPCRSQTVCRGALGAAASDDRPPNVGRFTFSGGGALVLPQRDKGGCHARCQRSRPAARGVTTVSFVAATLIHMDPHLMERSSVRLLLPGLNAGLHDHTLASIVAACPNKKKKESSSCVRGQRAWLLLWIKRSNRGGGNMEGVYRVWSQLLRTM